ncbi:MAG: carboxymuconolactone decarboxylase family protein [Nocardioides sp.]
MNQRLRPLRPEELDAAQRAVYDSVAGGERAAQTQHFPLVGPEGELHGPFGPMLLSAGVGGPLQELGAAIRFRSDLDGRTREIAILTVAQAMDSAFEWWAHARVGRAAGLSEAEIEALSKADFTSADPVENAAVAFCADLLDSPTVTDEEFERASSVLTDQQMVDLTVLVGYYRTLAQLMQVFAIGIPDDGEPDML